MFPVCKRFPIGNWPKLLMENKLQDSKVKNHSEKRNFMKWNVFNLFKNTQDFDFYWINRADILNKRNLLLYLYNEKHRLNFLQIFVLPHHLKMIWFLLLTLRHNYAMFPLWFIINFIMEINGITFRPFKSEIYNAASHMLTKHLICWQVFGLLKKQHIWRCTVISTGSLQENGMCWLLGYKNSNFE